MPSLLHASARVGVLITLLCLVLARPTVADPTTPAVSAPISASEYETLLTEYRRAIKEQLAPEAAARLHRRFSQAGRVSLPDGTVIEVNNKPVMTVLKGIAQKQKPTLPPSAAAERADLLSGLLKAPVPSPAVDPKQEAARILDAREFRDAAKQKVRRTWLDDVRDWITDQLEKFYRWLTSNRTRGRAGNDGGWFAQLVQWVLIVFAVVAAIVGLHYLVRWASLNLPTLRRRSSVISGLDLLEESLPNPLGSSRELAANRDYRGALRLAYIACLRRLAQSGLVILQENRTNWEYQRSLRGRSARASELLLPATRLFDQVWYGQRSATAEEYQTVVGVHDSLARLLESETPSSRAEASAPPVGGKR